MNSLHESASMSDFPIEMKRASYT